jgi:hypothetical protein
VVGDEFSFYNKRGTSEQWIKEGKQAVKMTRLSCHRFRSNEVRLWLSVIAYNLGNLWRRVHSDGSYASASDPRVLFGLGGSAEIIKMRSFWADGRVEDWTGIPIDRYTTLHEGRGTTVRGGE